MLLQIGELQFATKAAAVAHFRRILHAYPIGPTVPEPEATQLKWLLHRHDEAAIKIGAGIDHFQIACALYGKKGFVVVRCDGTTTDFSYLRCVDGKAPSTRAQVFEAMRAEVQGNILDRKQAYFNAHADAAGKVKCAVTGALISIDEAHADHAAPWTFNNLAVAFLTARGIKPDDPSLITPPADNQYQPRLVDRVLAGAWRAHHHSLATIRIVAKNFNERSREGRPNPKNRQLILATNQ
jgi:Protein of unknown function (DUF3223)